ncbi:M20/M25/M40 family metallo-hydrolase [Christiangramia sediminis]|uniref:M20/M25/M40 family metallo-hydrolase n=1 Tax=Christiangramia sediminis TaxID=2881336 RepID=A0A9X1LJ10_9FLAO|nr:M20/M25/M40 family metallo-hydrolase [Christiangramia sediminis]MCB7481268.1 M20/M25/M40 family metallo-hydrolase [Christiangramia sediminis]
MRKITLFSMFNGMFIMLFTVLSCTGQTKKTNELEVVKTEVSVTEVQDDLTYLASDELMGRKTGSAGIEDAAVFIENKFKNFGVEPYFETYRDHFMIEDVEGFNIVGYLEGNDPELKDEFIVVGAHYDHIGLGKEVEGDTIANGANDNAAGTVGVIQLAKHFSQINQNKRSIIFALFSGEEMGLKGSKHLANKLKAEELDLYVMFNLEMIGVPMKAKDYKAYLTGFEKSNLAEKFNEYSNGEEVLGFLPQAQQMSLFKRSDNYPFFEAFNVPSQTVSTFDFSNYPYYHHVDDESEFLNAEFMASLIEDLLPGLQKMTNTEEKEIKMID